MSWVKTYSKTYQGIKKEDVWKMWADINNYTQWHHDLDYCKLEGTFSVGNHFTLKPKGAPAVKIKIIKLIENEIFIDCTKFPGARMYDIHQIEETPNGICITSTVEVKGLLSFLWVKLVAKKVASAVPTEMDSLVNLVRKNNA